MTDEEIKRLVSCIHCKKCMEIVYGLSAKCGKSVMPWERATALWFPEDFECFIPERKTE